MWLRAWRAGRGAAAGTVLGEGGQGLQVAAVPLGEGSAIPIVGLNPASSPGSGDCTTGCAVLELRACRAGSDLGGIPGWAPSLGV